LSKLLESEFKLPDVMSKECVLEISTFSVELRRVETKDTGINVIVPADKSY